MPKPPNFSGLKKTAAKRRSRLDEPPAPNDTFGNLKQPEHAPAASAPERQQKSLRTAGLGLKITPEHKKKLKLLAFSEGDKEAGILEKAIDLYYSKNPPAGDIS